MDQFFPQVPAYLRLSLSFMWETAAPAVVLWRSELIQAYIVKRVREWRQNMNRRNTAAVDGRGQKGKSKFFELIF